MTTYVRPERRETADGYQGPPKVVATTLDCEIVLDSISFYARCTATNCTWVSDRTASKSTARRYATQHEEAS